MNNNKNNQEKLLKCNKIIEDLNITINSLKN